MYEHDRKWHDYFMRMAASASIQSSCGRRKVGAVIVKDRSIIATGYNGTPRGLRNCIDGGCPRFATDGKAPMEEARCVHAEENAILQCAKHGASCRDSVMYSMFFPCMMCAKMIINVGIVKLYYVAPYPDTDKAMEMLQEAGVAVEQIKQI